jgi:hypothetical protein
MEAPPPPPTLHQMGFYEQIAPGNGILGADARATAPNRPRSTMIYRGGLKHKPPLVQGFSEAARIDRTWKLIRP